MKGFEFFEGVASENTAPRITVRRSGQLVLTKGAVDMLGDGVTHVQLGYNPEKKAVALRAAGEDVKGRYLLRAQRNSKSRLVDGKRFLAHHEVGVEKATGFAVEDFGGGLVGFVLRDGKG